MKATSNQGSQNASLFSAAQGLTADSSPLADRMRPKTLDEFVGQEHIVGEGCLLRRAIMRDRLSSIILSGPPGTGKTTLARVIANTTQARFVALNAVLAGVQAIRDAIESAQRDKELYSRKTILFVDEVHRWNKAQQDALLPWVENGTIILIGATTENPFFEVNKALVSRSRVFQLNSLNQGDLLKAARFALADKERGYGKWTVAFEEGALEHLIHTANGDARTLLNSLELAVETSCEPWPPEADSVISVSLNAAEQSIQRRAVLYDRDGDYHYDAASALIKSIRGSDPDAALYWLAKMVYSGEDPRFLFRRLLISAGEDIGLADPGAIGVTLACAQAFERVGMPEGQYHIAEAVIYLSTAPKSNSCAAFYEALAAVERDQTEVPNHLKDANRDAKDLGHGKGYQYPHDSKDHWVAQQYLPDPLRLTFFYRPGSLGYEAKIKDSVDRRRDAQIAAFHSGSEDPGTAPPEPKTSADETSKWKQRTDALDTDAYQALEEAILAFAGIAPMDTVLLPAADSGLLIRGSTLAASDGATAAVLKNPPDLERMTLRFSGTESCRAPKLILSKSPSSDLAAVKAALDGQPPTKIISVDSLKKNPEGLKSFLAAFPDAQAILAQRVPAGKGQLPAFLSAAVLPEAVTAFTVADAEFFDLEIAAITQALSSSLGESGRTNIETLYFSHKSDRVPSSTETGAWLSPESRYGSFLDGRLGPKLMGQIREGLLPPDGERSVSWPLGWILMRGTRA